VVGQAFAPGSVRMGFEVGEEVVAELKLCGIGGLVGM
jgi:hypothetical protein